MFKVTVDGITRIGEFEIEGEQLRLTHLKVDSPMTACNGDVLVVSIREVGAETNLKEVWMVLWGTPNEIVESMDIDFPMSKMESDAIFDYLDTVEPTTTKQMLTYPVTRVASPVIAKSRIHKTLRAALVSIVAKLFECPELQITRIKVDG